MHEPWAWLQVWDVRTFRPMHSFKAPAPVTSLDISQRGLLATGQGRRVQVRCRRSCTAGATRRAPLPATRLPTGRTSAPVTPPWPQGRSRKHKLRQGWGRSQGALAAQVYQDALQTPVRAPYLTHMVQRGAVHKLRFCPYEARPWPASLPGQAACV